MVAQAAPRHDEFQRGIGLRPVHGVDAKMQRGHGGAQVDEAVVRAQQQDAAPALLHCAQVFQALEMDAVAVVGGVAEPGIGGFQHADAVLAKDVAHHALAHGGVEFGKAQRDVGGRVLPAQRQEVPGEFPEGGADAALQGPGQLRKQPEQDGQRPGGPVARMQQGGSEGGRGHQLNRVSQAGRPVSG